MSFIGLSESTVQCFRRNKDVLGMIWGVHSGQNKFVFVIIVSELKLPEFLSFYQYTNKILKILKFRNTDLNLNNSWLKENVFC